MSFSACWFMEMQGLFSSLARRWEFIFDGIGISHMFVETLHDPSQRDAVREKSNYLWKVQEACLSKGGYEYISDRQVGGLETFTVRPV